MDGKRRKPHVYRCTIFQHTEVRQMVGRLDTKETVLERLAALRTYGQSSVVIDLIYGLPGSNYGSLEQDLADLVFWRDGADLYQLNRI